MALFDLYKKTKRLDFNEENVDETEFNRSSMDIPADEIG
jgi:hypothetical protein